MNKTNGAMKTFIGKCSGTLYTLCEYIHIY